MKKLLFFCGAVFLLSSGCRAQAAWESSASPGAAGRAAALETATLAAAPSEPFTRGDLVQLLGGEPPGEDVPLTRGELCHLLCAYIDSHALAVSSPQADPPPLADVYIPQTRYAAEIRTAISWGLVGPDADGYFYPENTVTAAQAALALSRLRQMTLPLTRRAGTPANSLAAGAAQDTTWLSDACIIGHSHAVGMRISLKLDEPDYYAKDGMSAVYLLDYDGFEQPDGSTGSLRWGLQLHEYRKVYLILGTNDMPGGLAHLPVFEESMRRIIELTQELQPCADLYLLSIAPVGQAYCDYSPNFSKDYVTAYNRVLKSLSRDYQIQYIDIFTPLSDAAGYMDMSRGSADALHFTADGYRVFLDQILTHSLAES